MIHIAVWQKPTEYYKGTFLYKILKINKIKSLPPRGEKWICERSFKFLLLHVLAIE